MSNAENTDMRSAGIVGLSEEEAKRLADEGFANVSHEKHGKSVLNIIKDNLLTYFNLIWLIVAVLLIACKSFGDLTFLFIIVPNVLISIVQEIRAKRTVEKLSLTTDPIAIVVRDGVERYVDYEEIVLGDVIKVELGRQVLSDAVVISGIAEANESMLTGEADAIKKTEGDTLLAGSFIVSGCVYAKVVAVGKDNYINKLEKEAKQFKAPASNLFRDLNSLIKVLGIMIIPVALLQFFSNWLAYSKDIGLHILDFSVIDDAVVKTCGSVIGMIPAGVYLLVTITLTLSVIALAEKDTLVQDMYSVEMLASADVICLDKTGTITDGTMCVSECIPQKDVTLAEIHRIMGLINATEQSANNTSQALIDHFGIAESAEVLERVPFSSQRKYSAVSISGCGIFAIGAPHFAPCPIDSGLDGLISSHAALGERVLVLVRLDDIDGVGEAIAVIAIRDRIRASAKETIRGFQESGVCVKVISGDHAETVSAIAASVGINDADKYISCEGMSDDDLYDAAEHYAVFGRVTPEQKVLLIRSLKDKGHTVAMTGDGVNDILALKESNCSIAMAEGSDAARQVSQIVLLNSDFSSLPSVVKEGRKCINNVRSSATLYLMKTIFTVLLSLLSIITLWGYPFAPKQLLLLELFVIGASSVMLSLEPNAKRVEGTFIETVLAKSAPKALAMLLPVFLIMAVGSISTETSILTRNAVALICLTLAGYINLVGLCYPYTKWRVFVVSTITLLLPSAALISIFVLDDMLSILPALDDPVLLICAVAITVAGAVALQFFGVKIERWAHSLLQKRRERQTRGNRFRAIFRMMNGKSKKSD